MTKDVYCALEFNGMSFESAVVSGVKSCGVTSLGPIFEVEGNANVTKPVPRLKVHKRKRVSNRNIVYRIDWDQTHEVGTGTKKTRDIYCGYK